jgi:hypothetical protein
MTKVLTAFSQEPDNPEKAAADILGQLDLGHNLLKNAVGLLFGYVDFITSGAVKRLCSSLPFDVLGCTSQGIVLHQGAEQIMLALVVLTSDEAEFSTVLSPPLTTQCDMDACMTELYRQAAAPLNGAPSLIFIFPPLIPTILTGQIVDVLDRESGNTPVFGAVAVDVAVEIRLPLAIFNGEAWADRMPLLVMTGVENSKFFLVTLPRQNLIHQEAVVTAAEGNRIIGLDKEPAVNYLKKVGLIQGEGEGYLKILYAFPMEIDFHDGKPPRVFAIYSIDAEGSIVCGGRAPVGSTLFIRSIGSSLVLQTASFMAGKIKGEWDKNKNYHGLLIFSCFSRNLTLADPVDEMMVIQNTLADFSLPYLFLYAAGEYCPVPAEKGPAANGFHQYTITACLF